MAERNEALSSYVTVDILNFEDFDKEDVDLLAPEIKRYLEDNNKSRGGKFAADGFKQNPNSERQYFIHFASVKTAERVLKREEHIFEVNGKQVRLSVQPCPAELLDVASNDKSSSDGESEDRTGQRSSGSSDIEVISPEEANSFTFVEIPNEMSQQNSEHYTPGIESVPFSPDQDTTAIIEASAENGSEIDQSNIEHYGAPSSESLDQYSRSIVIENVPEKACDTLRLLLENRKKGGGELTVYERNADSKQVLATFEDLTAVDNFLKMKSLTVFGHVMDIHQPLLLKQPEASASVEASFDRQVALELDKMSSQVEKDADVGAISNQYEDQREIQQSTVAESQPSRQEVMGTNDDELESEVDADEEKNEDQIKKSQIVAQLKEEMVDERSEDRFLNLESVEVRKETLDSHSTVRSESYVTTLSQSDTSSISKEEEIDRTVDVLGVNSEEAVDLIVGMMENRRKGGGEIISDSLNEQNGVLTVIFKDKKIADHFLALKSFKLMGTEYMIHSPVRHQSDPTDLSHSEASGDFTVDVHGVDSEETVDLIVGMMEHRRKGGGQIMSYSLNDQTGVLTVIFEEQKVADKFVGDGSIKILEKKLSITKAVKGTDAKGKKQVSVQLSDVPESSKSSFPDVTVGIAEATDTGYSTILVSDIPDNFIATRLVDTKLMSFKGKKMPIKSCPESFVYKGGKNSFSPDFMEEKPAVSDGRAIWVKNIPHDFGKETLQMIFESKRHGGGDVEDLVYNREQGTASVTFRDPKVASALVSKKVVVFKNSQLLVTKYSGSLTAKQSEEVNMKNFAEGDNRKRLQKSGLDSASSNLSLSNRTIQVTGISPNINSQTMMMVFENKRFGGGKVEDFYHEANQKTAVITFQDPNVAESFVQKGVVEFKGESMYVSSYQENDAYGQNLGEHSSLLKQAETKTADTYRFNTIKVSGLKPTTSKHMISLYFENKNRSGGGKLQLIEHFKEKGKAVIRFNDPNDALAVYKKKHKLEDSDLTVTALEMVPDEIRSCAVVVKGLSEKVSQTLLTLYFENRSRSGSDAVEELIMDEKSRSAVVVFEDAEVVSRVMQKRPHTLENVAFEVNVLEPAPPPPLLLSDIDAKRLLAKRLPPSTTEDKLMEYLSKGAGAEMLGWTKGVKQSTALLDFSSEPDYQSIRKLVIRKPFQGTMISIQRVAHTSCILVSELPISVSKDFLEMYFESARCGNATGEQCNVELFPEKNNNCAVVKFNNPSVIHGIILRKHVIEKKPVKLQPYYPCLGLVSSSVTKDPSAAASGVSSTDRSTIPTSVILKCDMKALDFVSRNPWLQTEIADSLKKCQSDVCWPSGGKAEVTLRLLKGNELPTAEWGTESKKVLQGYLDQLNWKKENVLQETWTDFKKKMDKIKHTSPKLQIGFNNENCEIHYIGLNRDKENFEKVLNEAKHDLEQELEKRNKHISENMSNLKSFHLALIKSDKMQKELKAMFRDVEFELKTNEVNLLGLPESVKKAKLHLLMKIAEATSQSLDVSSLMRKVLADGRFKTHLIEKLNASNISAAWSCDDSGVEVYAYDDSDLKQAINILRDEFVEMQENLNDATAKLIDSDKWKEFMTDLQKGTELLEFEYTSSAILTICERKSAEEVKRRIKEFFDEYGINEEFVDMDIGFVEVISRWMSEKLQNIGASLKMCGGTLTVVNSATNSGFNLSGNEGGVKKAREELKKLSSEISCYDHEISRPGIPDYFYSKQGQGVLDSIQNKHKVSIQLDSSSSHQPHIDDNDGGEIYRLEVRPGRFLIVSYGDITKCRVDAIVNAANEDLKHIGGVAKAIADAAGHHLEEDSLSRVKLEGKVLPGRAFITRAGRLPCKKVIHVVGPQWTGGTSNEENILFNAVESALAEADTNGLRTVAMPAISTGIFGFPLNKAIDIIVDGVKNYLIDNTVVREVTFIDNDRQTVKTFEEKLKSVKPVHTSESEEKNKGRGLRNAVTSQQSGNSNVDQSSTNTTFPALGPNTISTPEGVNITLVKGSISSHMADILVNTTGKELNLSHGNVSQSLLAVAGPELQAECNKNKPRNFDYGDIVVTKGYKLSCVYVYHGSCRGWDSGAGNCEQTVRKFMRNLLEQGESHKQKSIAIPAIGTGNLRIPHKLVAKIMYDEVTRFSTQRKPKNLLDVQFVVYDKDNESIKAFEEKIRELRPGLGFAGGTSATKSQNFSTFLSSSVAPSFKSGVSFEQASMTVNVGPIQVKLKEGDITKEQADAVVNSTDERLNMTGGAVAKAILKAGGPVVAADCKKVKMKASGVCVTVGGDLKARYIIHLVAGQNANKWKQVIVNGLLEAENLKFSHIVFPMLGTGQIGQSASSMAKIMIESISDFHEAKKPQHLRMITICIFQMHMLQEFAAAVSSMVQPTQKIGSTQRSRGLDSQSNENPRPRAEKSVAHISQIVLSIYALSQKSVENVVKDVEDVIKEFIIDKVLDSPSDQANIAKLQPQQIERIRNLAKEFPVQIEIDNHHLHRLRIRGAPLQVTCVIEKVHSIFHEAQEKEIKKKEQALIATVAHWEYEDGSDFEKYPDDINALIETAYRARKPSAEWEEENAKYRLDFRKMVEEFLTNPGTPPVKVRRVAKEIDIPTHWAPMGSMEEFKAFELQPADQEYKDVEKAVLSTAQTSMNTIVKIERIQNKMLYKQYVTRRDAMDKANPAVQNEKILWHGTSADTVFSINNTGFNRSYCGKNAVVYGRGVYFAKNFSYSAQNQYSPPDANGIKHIYQSRVLTGEYAVGNQSLIVPSQKPGGTNARYDSTVDNLANPTIFVIFYDTQAYPEYLVYFK